MLSNVARFAVLTATLCLAACSTPDLTPEGAAVEVSPSPPPAVCSPVANLVGHGGGTFGGAYVANDDLIEYAMNDLRNQAAERGANYVQNDPAQLGSGDGTTTTATVHGRAYRCPTP